MAAPWQRRVTWSSPPASSPTASPRPTVARSTRPARSRCPTRCSPATARVTTAAPSRPRPARSPRRRSRTTRPTARAAPSSSSTTPQRSARSPARTMTSNTASSYGGALSVYSELVTISGTSLHRQQLGGLPGWWYLRLGGLEVAGLDLHRQRGRQRGGRPRRQRRGDLRLDLHRQRRRRRGWRRTRRRDPADLREHVRVEQRRR